MNLLEFIFTNAFTYFVSFKFTDQNCRTLEFPDVVLNTSSMMSVGYRILFFQQAL